MKKILNLLCVNFTGTLVHVWQTSPAQSVKSLLANSLCRLRFGVFHSRLIRARSISFSKRIWIHVNKRIDCVNPFYNVVHTARNRLDENQRHEKDARIAKRGGKCVCVCAVYSSKNVFHHSLLHHDVFTASISAPHAIRKTRSRAKLFSELYLCNRECGSDS